MSSDDSGLDKRTPLEEKFVFTRFVRLVLVPSSRKQAEELLPFSQ
jgi:hypothetical protein